MRIVKQIMAVAALLTCLSACVIDSDSDDYGGEGLLEEGTVAPDFMIYTDDFPDGFALSSLRGRYVVLEFWASWCPDCQAATPDMKNLYDTFASEDMVFVGFSLDTDEADWRAYIKENEMNWLQYCEFIPWKDSAVASAYHVNWIPTVYLIDKEGRVLFAADDISEMKDYLNSLSAQP